MNLSHVLCVLAAMLPVLFCYEKISISELDIDLGGKAGLSVTSSISNENLQKILAGVESGNKDNIYFYGLIKLYGISVSKDSASASANFLRASNLGHMEATTAYGVSLLMGMGVKQDYLAATQYFRKAVAMGDLVRNNVIRIIYGVLIFTLYSRMHTGYWASECAGMIVCGSYYCTH